MSYFHPEPSLDPPDYTVPRCPICGEECYSIYTDRLNVVVGCDNCIAESDAWDWEEENGHSA